MQCLEFIEIEIESPYLYCRSIFAPFEGASWFFEVLITWDVGNPTQKMMIPCLIFGHHGQWISRNGEKYEDGNHVPDNSDKQQ